MTLRMLVLSATVGLWAVGVRADTPGAWMGTWKLNVAKSKYGSEPPPKSEIVKNVPAEGGGYTQTVDGVEADDKAYHREYTAWPDGKEHPRKGFGDVISVKKIDQFQNRWVVKKDGKVTVSGRTSYSRDGKIRTLTSTFKDKQGRKITISEVYDRQ